MQEIPIDPLTWPSEGRVGYCTTSSLAGTYIFMHLGTDTRDPEHASWQVFFNPESEEWAREDLFQDGQSPIIPDLIREWGVEWCPEEIEPDVETRLFGLRRLFRERGAELLRDPVGPRVGPPPTCTRMPL